MLESKLPLGPLLFRCKSTLKLDLALQQQFLLHLFAEIVIGVIDYPVSSSIHSDGGISM